MLKHEWALKQYGKVKKPDTRDHILYNFIYIKMSRIGKYMETLCRQWGWQERGMQSNCEWVWGSFLELKKVLKLDSGEGSTTLKIF